MEAQLALLLVAALAAPALMGPHETTAEWTLVQYGAPITEEEQVFLRSVAPIFEYSPPYGYVALLTDDAREAILQRAAVVGVGQLPISMKAGQGLDRADRLRLLLYPDADPARLAAHLLGEGAAYATRPDAREAFLDLDLGAIPLEHVPEHPQVRWIEPLRDRIELDNARASSIVQSGANEAWPLHDAGLDGSTQIVGYCDTGLDTDAPLRNVAGRTLHEMFADPNAIVVHNAPISTHRKVALYYSAIEPGGLRGDLDDDDGHGTHVAGTLAGDAGIWGARDGNDGVAFAARLAVCDITTAAGSRLPADRSSLWQPAYEVGARVHSNSWGTFVTDEYTIAARQQDAYAWEHRDFQILRSMGNSGPEGMMQAEAAAKSVLAIGATRSDPTNGSVMEFSARGPAVDGRIKPDLVAPGGGCVTSASLAGPAAYECMQGTSQATPAAAGAATLVRDLFAKGLGPSGVPQNVSAALVRATLIASAVAVASAAPDGAEGWGRPQLERALGGLALAQDEAAPLTTGGSWTSTLDVAGGGTLRLVLAWTDFPAGPGSSPALVNDLDLELELPGGFTMLGNADLAAPDRLNVVERIVASDLAEGTYVVRVRAHNVPMGPQPFALVALVE